MASPPEPPRFCPHYPPPSPQRPSFWRMFSRKKRSWLDALYEGSYTMKMGEVHLFASDLYMVNEPALVRHVLEGDTAADFRKHPALADALRPLLGRSVFTTRGRVWREQRAQLAPLIDAQATLRLYPCMQAALAATTQRLRARCQAQPLGAACDIETEMSHFAADTLLRALLGEPLERADARRVADAFARYQALAARLVMPGFFFGMAWLRPWWHVLRSRRAAAAIRTLLRALVAPRHAAARAGRPDPHDDLLAALLRAHDPQTGAGAPLEAVVDQIATLFLVGHETTASALSWAWHLVASSPRVQARLHAEAMLMFDPARTPPARLAELSVARNVFSETLRLFPPVGFIVRECTRAQSLRGKDIEPGDAVVVSPWLIHRHRALWSRPDEFDPDRYEHDLDQPRTRDSLRQAWLPFGLGARACIGAAFAQQAALLCLAGLAREFRMEALPGAAPEPVGRLTIRSAEGIWLRLSSRSAQGGGDVHPIEQRVSRS